MRNPVNLDPVTVTTLPPTAGASPARFPGNHARPLIGFIPRRLAGTSPTQVMVLLLLSLVLLGATSPGAVVQPGATVQGTIGGNGVQSYTFTANANDIVTVLLFVPFGSGVNPQLELRDPGGVLLAAPSTSALVYGYLAQINNLRLVSPGVHQVTCLNYTLFSGPFSLTLIKFPGTNVTDPGESGVLVPGQTNQSEILTGDMDVYTFFAIAGDSFRVQMASVGFSPIQPWLSVHAPDGAPLITGTNRPGPGKVVEAGLGCVAQTGTYSVLCRDALGDRGGTYSVSLRQTPTPAPPGTPPDYLSICHCANQAIVRWPTNAASYVLERSLHLPSTEWTTLNPPYPAMGGYYLVTNGVPFTNAFFRLRR